MQIGHPYILVRAGYRELTQITLVYAADFVLVIAIVLNFSTIPFDALQKCPINFADHFVAMPVIKLFTVFNLDKSATNVYTFPIVYAFIWVNF